MKFFFIFLFCTFISCDGDSHWRRMSNVRRKQNDNGPKSCVLYHNIDRAGYHCYGMDLSPQVTTLPTLREQQNEPYRNPLPPSVTENSREYKYPVPLSVTENSRVYKYVPPFIAKNPGNIKYPIPPSVTESPREFKYVPPFFAKNHIEYPISTHRPIDQNRDALKYYANKISFDINIPSIDLLKSIPNLRSPSNNIPNIPEATYPPHFFEEFGYRPSEKKSLDHQGSKYVGNSLQRTPQSLKQHVRPPDNIFYPPEQVARPTTTPKPHGILDVVFNYR